MNMNNLPERAELAAIFYKVKTARLVLRRLEIDDGPAIFAVHGDPATNVYNPAGPHPDLATSEEMLRECLQHWEACRVRCRVVHTASEARR